MAFYIAEPELFERQIAWGDTAHTRETVLAAVADYRAAEGELGQAVVAAEAALAPYVWPDGFEQGELRHNVTPSAAILRLHEGLAKLNERYFEPMQNRNHKRGRGDLYPIHRWTKIAGQMRTAAGRLTKLIDATREQAAA